MNRTVKLIIFEALSNGKPWTLSALAKLTKSTKVSTRISDLRKDGYSITNKIEYRKGQFYRSTYQLIATNNTNEYY